jgi:hypothetical protein
MVGSDENQKIYEIYGMKSTIKKSLLIENLNLRNKNSI